MFTFYLFEQDKKGRQRYTALKTVDAISGLSELEEMLLDAALSHFYFSGKRDLTFLVAEYSSSYRRNFVIMAKVKLNPAAQNIKIQSLTATSGMSYLTEEFQTLHRRVAYKVPSLIPRETKSNVIKAPRLDYPKLPTYLPAGRPFYESPQKSSYVSFPSFGSYASIKQQNRAQRWEMREQRK